MKAHELQERHESWLKAHAEYLRAIEAIQAERQSRIHIRAQFRRNALKDKRRLHALGKTVSERIGRFTAFVMRENDFCNRKIAALKRPTF